MDALADTYRLRGNNLAIELLKERAARADLADQLADVTSQRDTYRELAQQGIAALRHALQERDKLRATRDELFATIRELREQIAFISRRAA